MTKIKVGLYGSNGHQIEGLLKKHPSACLVHHGESLDVLLNDPEIELVSLCSPVRKNQAKEVIMFLEAGKHVYAEKPCAMTETELDMIMQTSRKTGRLFHEMAGTAFEQPYVSMRELVLQGQIGEVIQVLAQKSYPYHDGRPQNEDIDGGLLMQVGIHAFRFIEHVAGVRIFQANAIETKLGNPIENGGLHIAASFQLKLENGGVASVITNYLNPKGFGQWGNEHLRIFGTKGFIESVDGGCRTRMVIGEDDLGAIPVVGTERNYFDMFVNEILGKAKMPLSLEDELHPTRMVIRAKEAARRNI